MAVPQNTLTLTPPNSTGKGPCWVRPWGNTSTQMTLNVFLRPRQSVSTGVGFAGLLRGMAVGTPHSSVSSPSSPLVWSLVHIDLVLKSVRMVLESMIPVPEGSRCLPSALSGGRGLDQHPDRVRGGDGAGQSLMRSRCRRALAAAVLSCTEGEPRNRELRAALPLSRL